MTKKYAPIDWDEIRSKKVELPKFKNAKERSDFVAAMYKDADMMIDDEKILRDERNSIQATERMADPERRLYQSNCIKELYQDPANRERASARSKEQWSNPNHREYMEKIYQDPERRLKHSIRTKELYRDPEYQAKRKEMYESSEYREKYLASMENRKHDPEYQLKRKEMYESDKWKTTTKLATQKANSKPISCDGVIYASKGEAGLALAPENAKDKQYWVSQQLKKYPERFFYV